MNRMPMFIAVNGWTAPTANTWSDAAREAAALSRKTHATSQTAGGNSSAESAVGHANVEKHDEAAKAHKAAAFEHKQKALASPSMSDEKMNHLRAVSEHMEAHDAHAKLVGGDSIKPEITFAKRASSKYKSS